MKRNTEFHDFVVGDVLGHIFGITSRAMFGGWGIYKDGVIFALIIGGVLYFKVGKENRAQFEKHGSKPFHYKNKSKDVILPYWELPEEVMGDREMIETWIAQSAAVSAAKKKHSQ